MAYIMGRAIALGSPTADLKADRRRHKEMDGERGRRHGAAQTMDFCIEMEEEINRRRQVVGGSD